MLRSRTSFWHTLLIVFLDIAVLAVSGLFALLLRFDFSFESIDRAYLLGFSYFLPIQAVITVAVFSVLRMYRFVWRAVGVQEVAVMIPSVLLSWLIGLIGRLFLHYASAGQIAWLLPRSVLALELMAQMLLFIGMRCALRFWSVLVIRSSSLDGDNIMLIGAGAAGTMLLHEFTSDHPDGSRVRCIIDDNPAKTGKYLDGVRVVGGRDRIVAAAEKYHIDQIIYAIPSADSAERAAVLDICKLTGCRLRVVPGLYQLVSGEVRVSMLQDVKMEDLLGREPVQLDQPKIESLIAGKTVVVTGGGGSIGSELCRQIAARHPKTLVIFDISENYSYDIQQELWHRYGSDPDIRVEIGSVRDKARVEELFARYRPDLVFHAAAHKHVPLMEDAPAEAVKNNIFGTYHVVRACEKFSVPRFVLISTDKAVNPTSFMGATKRFCEMILQSRPRGGTVLCAVRFGNVLGSNGSVIPLFQKQIAAGGPVTVTDKRITRFFMTIEEAAQLVLEAGAMAQDRQIFVLDMGEPVQILTLAENLIRLSGKVPYDEIPITEIGLRPGEKLYEELLISNNDLTRTPNKKIFVEQQTLTSDAEMMDRLQQLDRAVVSGSTPRELVALLRTFIPEYRDPADYNEESIRRAVREAQRSAPDFAATAPSALEG